MAAQAVAACSSCGACGFTPALPALSAGSGPPHDGRRSASAPLVKADARGGAGRRRRRRANKPGLFEVHVISPPPRSLGVHSLPVNTHCEEVIEVDGQDYVVKSLVLKYRRERGAYIKDHYKLEVQTTSRFLLNQMLDGLLEDS